MRTPLRRARDSDTRRPTQLAVAEAVGITQGFYSKLELRKSKASPEIAERLCAFFGHRISEIEILFPERFTHPQEVA